ncbi:MAG: penicillin acylase family protein, partial [Bacteroidota bacterium]
MRLIKTLLLILGILVLSLLLFGYFYISDKSPIYEGRLDLNGLNASTEVIFDNYGVPHIYAQSDEDAFRALGYLHAQDRLWQMELIRRIAPGRLSEVFGADLVETDRFFKTLGIEHYSKKNAEALRTRNGKELLFAEAYIDGINQFMVNGFTPIEYDLVSLDIQPFTLQDMYNVMGYMSFSFAIAHKTEPVVSYMQSLPEEYLAAFEMAIPANTTIIRSNPQPDTTYVSLSNAVNKIFDGLPLAPFIGSNSWVVSAEKSASGKAVLSNDMHIGFSQPSVWYEAHISSPSFNYYGYHLAGIPFATVVHSDYIATGLTMFENDDLDFFRERVNPDNENQYWAEGEWLDFDVREETIKVKDGEDVGFTVRDSRHGPIMNDAVATLSNEAPVAAWWTYFQFDNYAFEATHKMAGAKNIDDVREAASLIHAPGLNVMYADKDDNIAWWAAGKLVKRPSHVNPKAILDGASGNDEPLGYYDFSDNPQAENPPWGYVYSANNQSMLNLADTNILYPGYYLHEGRAKRIVDVMESKSTFNRQDLKDLFMDNFNPVVSEIAPSMVDLIGDRDLTETQQSFADALEKWDGKHEKNSVGPALYYAWVMYMFEHAMIDELSQINPDMSEKVFNDFMSTHLRKRNMFSLMQNDSTVWWDNVSTEAQESRADIMYSSFVAAVDYLTERFGDNAASLTWDNYHTLEHGHALGQVEALRPYFNVGPFQLSGSDENLNNLGFPLTEDGIFNVTFGPSTRRIIDFADVGSSESILPTGQSGNIFSEHYEDQAEMYANGQWRRMLFEEEDIKGGGFRKLMLNPAEN